MAKHSNEELNLFDMIEKEEIKEHPENCNHRRERKTWTIWLNENFERATWTCDFCGRIRGRCP